MLIRIDIHADILCPWCYINKQSLEAGMERFRRKHAGAKFDIKWHPYYATPHPNPKFSKEQYYMMRWGVDKFDAYIAHVRAAAARHNLSISLDGSTGSSRKCHQLLQLALRLQQGNGGGQTDEIVPSMQTRLVELFFRGQFRNGEDVTDDEWLQEVAVEAGLPPRLMRETLLSAEMADRVDAEVAKARHEYSIEAVPCVTVQGVFRIGGYQEESLFEGVFERVWDEAKGT